MTHVRRLGVGVWIAAVALAASGGVARAGSAVVVDVKIIRAHNQSRDIDARIAGLVKEFGALKFTGYELVDQAHLTLETANVGRMRLPSGAWLTLNPLGMTDDKLHLELEVKELKFKTTVSIAPGATLAIGGPPYDGGALILAVTRRAETVDNR